MWPNPYHQFSEQMHNIRGSVSKDHLHMPLRNDSYGWLLAWLIADCAQGCNNNYVKWIILTCSPQTIKRTKKYRDHFVIEHTDDTFTVNPCCCAFTLKIGHKGWVVLSGSIYFIAVFSPHKRLPPGSHF